MLSDEELAELIALAKGADSVELKLTVPVSDRSRGAAALGVDPLDAQIRQVYFFDTPELTLNKAGVVVRARRVQRKGDDTVVKLRPVVPDQLPEQLRRSPNFGVEVDAMPGGFVCSGSMKRALKTPEVRDAVFGKLPVRKLYSKEQRALYTAHAPDGLALNDLSILGPITHLLLQTAEDRHRLTRPDSSPAGFPRCCSSAWEGDWPKAGRVDPRGQGRRPWTHHVVGLLGVRSHTSKNESRSWPDTSS